MTGSTRVRSLRAGGIVAATLAACLCSSTRLIEAHKPITSPFTFSDDVLPIVKARCASCHSPGGVAPMSLLTHADAVPWGESIRVELMAGHMPPWGVDVSAGRFRNLQHFSAREMNVLLTWASGGTPPGQTSQDPAAAFQPHWALGTPDQTISLHAVQIGSDTSEHVEEIEIPVPNRPLRAVDLLPGTPAIVRRATISIRAGFSERGLPGLAPERLVALWLPGDHPVALDPGLAFEAGNQLAVRIHYRKTWQHERQAMTDQSTIGLYFADAGAADVHVLRALSQANSTTPETVTTTVGEDVRAVAVYADPNLSGARLAAVALRPDGSREELISFRPRADWARRYWFREPISLPRGTRIQVTGKLDDALLPPAAARPPQPAARAPFSLALNVVRAK
jgi:hypothetical protein